MEFVDPATRFKTTIYKIFKNLLPPTLIVFTLLRWDTLTNCCQRELIILIFLIIYIMFIPRHLGNICLGAVGMTILFWAGMYLEYVDKRNQLECYRDDDGNLELFIYWAYKVCLYVVTMITPPIVAIWCKRWCRQMRQEEGAQNLVEDVSVDSEP